MANSPDFERDPIWRMWWKVDPHRAYVRREEAWPSPAYERAFLEMRRRLAIPAAPLTREEFVAVIDAMFAELARCTTRNPELEQRWGECARALLEAKGLAMTRDEPTSGLDQLLESITPF